MEITVYYQDGEYGFENGNRLGEGWDDARLCEVCSRTYNEIRDNKELIRDLLNKD